MAGGDRRNADSVLVTALAAGATVEAAAKTAGVSERTAYRRLDDPAFRQGVINARAEMVSRAVARLSATSTLAADTLRKLLDARSETVRLGAARAILELGSKLRESEDLAERVRALEERLGDGKETKPWTPRTA
jgi:HEAT repeat protein